MAKRKSKALEGIEERHSRSCGTNRGKGCSCEPSIRAAVMVDGQRQKRTFTGEGALAAAKQWRRDAARQMKAGHRPRTAETVEEAAERFLRDARAGVERAKSGHRFKPGTLRRYEQAIRLRVLPAFEGRPLDDVRQEDWQALIFDLLGQKVNEKTIEGTIAAASLLYPKDPPTRGVKIPRAPKRDMRIAPPREAGMLLAAVPERDRAIWASAMYAGLRRGELMGLTMECIDLNRGIIRVERGWDEREGPQETKGRERRVVPIPSVLSELLLSHLARTGRKGEQLAFGVTGDSPFVPMSVRKRADDAWAAAGLKRITLHQCRHTYASFLIAAGVNAKAIQTYMGHSSITITFDTYGHLFPGNEEEAAGLLDGHLAAAVG